MEKTGTGRTAWLLILLAAVVISVAVRSYVIEPYTVIGQSMQPTLVDGERLLVAKFVYRSGLPRRGDIIVFSSPHRDGSDYVKRIIGLPGDTVELRLGRVYINGAPLEEPYLGQYPSSDFGPARIGAGGVFVLGDNRGNSEDSRYFGEVPLTEIKGKVVACIWPLRRAGKPR